MCLQAILGIMAGLMQSKGAPIRSPQAGSTGAVKDTSNVTPHSSRQSGSSILEASRLAEMRQMLKQIEHWLNKLDYNHKLFFKYAPTYFDFFFQASKLIFRVLKMLKKNRNGHFLVKTIQKLCSN